MISLQQLDALQQRLFTLENEKRVSACMNQYMHLCDDLAPGFELKILMDLFTEEAIWEGKGQRYAKTFGRYEGKAAIEAMFAKYATLPGHFNLNVHLLGNEVISVDGNKATGTWLLMQPSDFVDGRSQLSCAKITATFELTEQTCQISHFVTENKFSRPMAKPWDNSAALPVPE
ncbi:nuclear transport factor 2 family protein [Aliiglaciecola sp. 3_MG-2023]|uniref:nuclear transport factor 2 family protein n=1 Tax=Aliiglaciecola sp. 3_MG-2023 TaxID=3062644 RepID=UPI0026E24CE2|nr:nuclear transport factor 2 family protein [Aliiglaciecola sp. 3_MG-2023]MDO6694755.1 nuclear transport factor 2 family protein [Aliiglaciecola sp. 3_MG-2023]